MKEIRETEEKMKERLSFVDDLVSALKEGIHTDILIQPGSGPPIPAHRALLAIRSEIFKTVLSSDECKAPAEDTISLPEMSHEEVQCLLEFLYCGTLKPKERAQAHACALLIAADKYNIPFLKEFCEDLILQSLGPCNSLQVLEVADTCSNVRLKEHAMDTIVKHMEDVVLSAAYDSFALKNGHLSVEITRALLIEMKKAKRTEPGVELRAARHGNNALSQPEMTQISDFVYSFPSS
ncbi:BTB/POZ domain-containing protein [Iris pallida]|uniref:BTB/POZ domain-containing protein n=1 Tax=Iris pallida TaxID=29817 RepID=A0AAX6G0N9_IRIPA|nr:BTB/POZ domain-containing protein [Iris pallida]KAJ6817489.1 BTB/POZ domain-containing protein [Iris pallida]KAJ6822013.1 BTB/POZ domain-containing protein [Iris pallida]KAJ6853857.1 BTB/POZ domain-containing protein [Iris pallida]